MKTPLKTLGLMCALGSVGAAHAATTVEVTQEAYARMQEYTRAGQYELAYSEGLRAMTAIREELKTDDLVQSIHRRTDTIVDEKVVRKDNDGISFQGLLLGASFSSKTDLTRLMVRNPDEIAEFPEASRESMRTLRRDLVSFVAGHASEIAMLKTLGIEVLKLSTRMKTPPSAAELSRVETLAGPLSFTGSEQVTSCVTINRVERSSSVGGSAHLLFASLSTSSASVVNPGGLTEKTCESTVNRVVVSSDEVVLVNLSVLDQRLQSWATTAQAQAMLRAPAPAFPKFGNPYYQ